MSNLERYKFRGISNFSGKWVFGLLRQYRGAYFIEWHEVNADMEKFLTDVKVDPATVGQWTGLQVGGVDLYEGDELTNISGRVAVVEWNDQAVCWDTTVRVANGNPRGMEMNRLVNVEITGNIHDKAAS